MPRVTRNERIAVALLLGVMFALMIGSSWNDSAIIDELAHVPAGYAYVFLRDYRLNPEHPPLPKMLAALPLAFTDVRFPTDAPSWRDDINGQWAQGARFLYESGNDPDRILRLMRLPLMLAALAFGVFFWLWTRRQFGGRVALLALALYALSPTFIAHSRYVTTDLAAAVGFFLGIVAFLHFLREPSAKNVLLAGLAFGFAQLLKFSLILLLPTYGLLLILWTASRVGQPAGERVRLFWGLAAKTLLAAAIGIAVIWIGYVYPVSNYPAERQYRDAEFILTSFPVRPLADADLWLIEHQATRPLGQYALGLLMVLQRAGGGNTQYFLGQVSAAGDARYFPVLYALKEALAFHILTAIALVAALGRLWMARRKTFEAALIWIRDHFPLAGAAVFIAVYWTSSIISPLNIGVRHVLPTFPFIYALVAVGITSWLHLRTAGDGAEPRHWLRRVIDAYVTPLPRRIILGALLIWMAISTIVAFPHYLSYVNGLAGGTDRGYLIAVDSNYDWGQDLKRLAAFVEAGAIGDIKVDYFGGGSPRYYLGDTFQPWSSAKGYPPGGGWLAVSATFQMGAYGEPVKGFIRRPEDSYEWLRPFRPVARAGKSIFIYNLPGEAPLGTSAF